jgi:biotin carboxyl carrier protein
MIFYARLKEGEKKVEIRKEGTTYVCAIDGKRFTADARLVDGPTAMSLIVNKRCYEAVITPAGSKLLVSTGGEEFEIELRDELEHRSLGAIADETGLGTEEIRAPMPGVVVSVEVERDQEVSIGTPVVIVEAMKMQNEISSVGGGRVKEILVKAGDVVESQQALVLLDRS